MTKPKTLLEIHQEKRKEKKKKQHKKSSNSDSEGEEKKKQEKLKKALNAEEARLLLHVKEMMQLDERKRPYNSLYETRQPAEEEMEAHRMKHQRPDDPVVSFLGQ